MEGDLPPPDLSFELYQELNSSCSYEEWVLSESLKHEIQQERFNECEFQVNMVGVVSKEDESKVRLDTESKNGFHKWIT